jgi:hypothetical protein
MSILKKAYISELKNGVSDKRKHRRSPIKYCSGRLQDIPQSIILHYYYRKYLFYTQNQTK